MQVSNRVGLNSLKMAKIWREDPSAAVTSLYKHGGGGGGGGGLVNMPLHILPLPSVP